MIGNRGGADWSGVEGGEYYMISRIFGYIVHVDRLMLCSAEASI